MDQRKPKRICRYLTVSGRQCQQNAIIGEDFCVSHEKYRHPVCPQKGGKVVIPLLEDVSAIQLVATQVAHGLFSESIDPWRAGKILYACQVAAMTVPRPAPVKTEPVEDAGPVAEVFRDLNGELLGPELPWLGVNGAFEPRWSRDKMLYEQECERLGKLKPQSPDDMPPEGWLTPDEQAEDSWNSHQRWMLKTLERRMDADKHYKLPPLEERACYYDNPHCGGPVKKGHGYVVCQYCAWEREAHERILRREKDPMPPKAREACAREGICLTLFPGDPPNESSVQAPESDDFVFVDEPEETEVLNPQKVTFLNMRNCADDVGTLPPLEERTCYYEMPDCAGPASPSPCTYCRRERDYYRKLHKGDGKLDLKASAGIASAACQKKSQTARDSAPSLLPQARGPHAPAVGAMGWRLSAQFRRNAADPPPKPRPGCQPCQQRQIPHFTRSPQPATVPGRPPHGRLRLFASAKNVQHPRNAPT